MTHTHTHNVLHSTYIQLHNYKSVITHTHTHTHIFRPHYTTSHPLISLYSLQHSVRHISTDQTAIQGILCVSWNQKVHNRPHNSPSRPCPEPHQPTPQYSMLSLQNQFLLLKETSWSRDSSVSIVTNQRLAYTDTE
jgi:hypothetical protein